MPTLLLSRTCQPEADRLALLAETAGWHCQWLERRATPVRIHGDAFGLYAETDIALRVAGRHRLALIEPSFDLLTLLPEQLLRRKMAFMTLGDAFQLPYRCFVKPADCTNKSFEAGVCDAGRYIRCRDDIPRETSVLVSEPVSWDIEYRVIVLNRQVITLSPYIRDGWLARDQHDEWPQSENETVNVLSLCKELLEDDTVPLPPVFTLDVGRIVGRGWAVIEFNPVWCSGLLGCDCSNLLPALERACRRQIDLSEEDAKWVIHR